MRHLAMLLPPSIHPFLSGAGMQLLSFARIIDLRQERLSEIGFRFCLVLVL